MAESPARTCGYDLNPTVYLLAASQFISPAQIVLAQDLVFDELSTLEASESHESSFQDMMEWNKELLKETIGMFSA